MRGAWWVLCAAVLGAVTLPIAARRIRREDTSILDDTAPPVNRSRRQQCSQPPPHRRVVTFPDSLVGRCNINYNMTSGYIPVTSTDYLFYWHFGPKEDAGPQTPVIFWTNGGPGCSAMEGAIDELGPLSLHMAKSGSPLYTGKLSDNPYSWNAYAHLVTVDQPRNVGYSYGTTSVHTSADAAADIVTFIQRWFDAFPEVDRNAPVFIAGESYAGHYVPAWGRAIMDHNHNLAADSTHHINLSGIALGNACVDDSVQVDRAKFLEFLSVARLIGPNDHPNNAAQGNAMAQSHLGYTPNFYDYRVQKVNCQGCYDYNYNNFGNFLMRQDVQDALGICGEAGDDAFANYAGGCINMGRFDSGVSTSTYTAHLGAALDQGIPVVLYYGKCDMACDYVGGIAMARDLPWWGRDAFRSAELRDLTIAGAAAAQIKGYGALTWIQIESAGHMVPADQPAAAFFAIRHLLRNGSMDTMAGAATGGGACPTATPCPVCPTCAPGATCPAPTPCPTALPITTPVPSSPPVPGCPAPTPCPQCPAVTPCPTVGPTPVIADDQNPIRCSASPVPAGGQDDASATDTTAAAAASSKSVVAVAAALGAALVVVSAALLWVLVTTGCGGRSGRAATRQYRASPKKTKTTKRSFSINQPNALYKSMLAESDEDY
eukprot:m.12076 g.12076  ORF g.12076 m.12076 type:complete len:658 (+) comp2906_c0_seq1:53-2026(+)